MVLTLKKALSRREIKCFENILVVKRPSTNYSSLIKVSDDTREEIISGCGNNVVSDIVVISVETVLIIVDLEATAETTKISYASSIEFKEDKKMNTTLREVLKQNNLNQFENLILVKKPSLQYSDIIKISDENREEIIANCGNNIVSGILIASDETVIINISDITMEDMMENKKLSVKFGNMFKKEGFTHGGVFHADEVMATAIFKLLNPDFQVTRGFNVPEDTTDTIVYDIGGGRYDHHQEGGNGVRESGIKYSSCGMIWRDYGMFLCGDIRPEKVWEEIDKSIIEGIDAHDNGQREESDVQYCTISSIVSDFNPTWDSSETSDDCFNRAVEFCMKTLKNKLDRIKSALKAEAEVEAAYEEAEDGLLILERFIPWKSRLLEIDTDKQIKFVLYPGQRGGWNINAVPDVLTCGVAAWFENRLLMPEKVRGKSVEELSQYHDGLLFVHPAGFIANADSKENAISIAKKVIAETC